jgi:hypothetical protein
MLVIKEISDVLSGRRRLTVYPMLAYSNWLAYHQHIVIERMSFGGPWPVLLERAAEPADERSCRSQP